MAANLRASGRHCALIAYPVDVQAVIDELDDSSAGGVTVFIGRVRDNDHGRAVVGLQYLAHPSALQQLLDLCDRIADEFEITGVAAVHRVGRLEIGDVAVVVATTAAHRGDAFAATRAMIDRLKLTVPIWKYQLFDDGDTAWVGIP